MREAAPAAAPPPAPPADAAAGGAGAAREALRATGLAGLTAPRKTLPAALLYDAAGAELFAAITRLDAYYPTRVEVGILRAHAAEIADRVGPGAVLLEYGSGEAAKVRLLLDALCARCAPSAYVPIDVSAEQLREEAARLAAAYPSMPVRPLVADYTRPFALPPLPGAARGARRVAFFPGSTIGNLHPGEAADFLRGVARTCGPGGGLVLGADLRKDPAVLHAAYNDPEGVTAAFNRNLLVRINRELGAAFDPARFAHYAFYEPTAGRVEMHLVSLDAQAVEVAGVRVTFERGESVWTESSYKYTRAGLAEIAAAGGFAVERVWTDPAEWFAVLYLAVAA